MHIISNNRFFLLCFLYSLCIHSFIALHARSIHRPVETNIPHIKAYWNEQSPAFHLTDRHIREYPIFTVNAQACYRYALPDTPITFSTNKTKKVTGMSLKQDLETLVQEIKDGRSVFSRFRTLCKPDFRRHKGNPCGLIILEHKYYPFVVKLYIEQPETFINPFCKGFVPVFFFFMAGGSNRHITGLTRIPNLHRVQQALSAHQLWRNRVKTPRKWFWEPRNARFFQVEGTNIGSNNKPLKNKFPHVYAVIADKIDMVECQHLTNKVKNKTIIKLCNDLNLAIDPHENNFIFQIDPITKRPIIVIVDTEHFLTMVGVTGKQQFTGHADFYLSLIKKCAGDIFLCRKDTINTHYYS